jgi:hydroxymethylpyrimidine/phosphomethylpyrimidine kinase
VPTAITVQSAAGVREVVPLEAALVGRQLAALLGDVRPAAVKVGMLGDGAVVRVVARALLPLLRKRIPIVVDPVLTSGDGRRLLPRKDVAVFVRQLVPLATLLTPNVAEAAELAGVSEARVTSHTPDVIAALLRTGAKAVLLKGGHLSGPEATDVLRLGEEMVAYSLPRLPVGRRVHGTGCALSAAIAALLAKGLSLEDAVQQAKEYVHAAIAGSRHVGRGARLLDFQARVGE